MSALRGNPSISPAEIYATTNTAQGTDLGAMFTTGDGRVFRYVSVGTTALLAGKVVQSATMDTTLTNLAIAAAGTNTSVVTTTSTVTLALNQLAGGILTVRDGTTALGFSYRIKSHPAATAAVVAITLEDPLQVGLTTSNHIDLIPATFGSVQIMPTTPTGIPVGVAVANIAAGNFGFVQTRGPVAVLSDASAPTVGNSVTPSGTTAGSMQGVSIGTNGSFPVLGYTLAAAVSAKYTPVFLQLE